MSGNGTWNGIMALVSSGIADIGVGRFMMSKERSEVVAFSNTLGFGR
jgi:ABC-type amino acid transport substrate-binding protein